MVLGGLRSKRSKRTFDKQVKDLRDFTLLTVFLSFLADERVIMKDVANDSRLRLKIFVNL